MSRITRWTGVQGKLVREIYTFQRGVYDGTKHLHIGLLNCFPDEESVAELVIHFRSSGYTDAGDFEHPPEGADDRTLEYAEVNGKRLPQDLAEWLFGHEYAAEIDEVEIEPRDE